jgi:hypothetical protein
MNHVWVLKSEKFSAYTVLFFDANGEWGYSMFSNDERLEDALEVLEISLPCRVHCIDGGGEEKTETIH